MEQEKGEQTKQIGKKVLSGNNKIHRKIIAINIAQSFFFEKLNKSNESLRRLTQKNKRLKLLKSELKVGITTDCTEIKRNFQTIKMPPFNGDRILFSTNGAKQLDNQMENNKFGSLLHIIKKK